MTPPAHGLRVDHLDHPLGIHARPRLSWRLPDGAAGQVAYRLRGDNGWDTGRGNVDTDHLRPAFGFLPAPLPAGMVDEVVAAGRAGEVFEPRRTTHGFRYVQLRTGASRCGGRFVRSWT